MSASQTLEETPVGAMQQEDAREALKALDPYLNEMLRCTRCGFCQAACPVYEELRTESSVARGKVQLIRAVKEGTLEPTETVARYLYRCLDCRLCQQTCPGGVHTDEIFEGGKRFLTAAGLLPTALGALQRRVDECHNIVGEDNANRLMWRENLPATCTPQGPCEIAFFTGCVASLFPMVYAIPQAFVQTLDHAGVGYVTLAGEEWCCGYPLLAAGLSADKLIEHNLAGIEGLGVRHLVAACPSCYKTWKSVYPKASFDILHSTELLLTLLNEGRIQPAHPPTISRKAGASGPLRVTYHDPCDLGRKAGVYDPPRAVIAKLPGVELVEMSANRALANCCGGGGNLESLEAELSAAIADRRLAQAQAVGAEVIVTACQQCQRTLSMAARRNKVRLPTIDVAQLVLATLE